jgi:hypothetical protein
MHPLDRDDAQRGLTGGAAIRVETGGFYPGRSVMISRYLLPLILAAVLTIGDAAAAHTSQIIGSGVSSCGAWTANRREFAPGRPITQGSQNALQEMQWVLGFLSGIGNISDASTDPLNNMDADGVWAWIDNYCQAHPLEHIVAAAKAFFEAHPN